MITMVTMVTIMTISDDNYDTGDKGDNDGKHNVKVHIENGLGYLLVVTIHEENHDCPGHLDSELLIL